MMTKFKNTPARKAGQIRGLVIEHHVSEWFRQHYSDEFEEADNYRQWTIPCAHDFKLNVRGKIHQIDVSGPKKDGTFGSYDLKPKYGVDYHMITSAIGFASWNKVDYSQGFEILGVVDRHNYTTELDIKKLQFTLSEFLTSIGLSASNLD